MVTVGAMQMLPMPRDASADSSIRAGVPRRAAKTERAEQYVYFPQTLRWVGDGSSSKGERDAQQPQYTC